MEILNNKIEEVGQVGGDGACYVVCAAGCVVTEGVGTAMVIAVLVI